MYIPKYSPLWWDYCFGWRCIYLVLYGVLPASLISLGVVQVKPITLPSTMGVSLFALLLIACVPIYVTYSLIKFKVDHYYLIKGDNKEKKYLLSWENIPGSGSRRLLRFLRDDFDIVWAENAKISKPDDGKIIRIIKDGNSAEITIDEREEKAILKINDDRTRDLEVEKENGKLSIKIYKEKKGKLYEIFTYNNIRASFLTSLILIFAAIVSMATGVISGRYLIAFKPQLFIESLLTAAISLVVSSALFMSILRENVDFPGLPNKSYVDLVSSIKDCMSRLTKNNRLIWKDKRSTGDLKIDTANCKGKIQDLQRSAFCRKNEKDLINQLSNDIDQLDNCLNGTDWQICFAKYYVPRDNKARSRRDAIKRIHKTNWGLR